MGPSTTHDDDVAALADIISSNTRPRCESGGVFRDLTADHTLTFVYAPGGSITVGAPEKKGSR